METFSFRPVATPKLLMHLKSNTMCIISYTTLKPSQTKKLQIKHFK